MGKILRRVKIFELSAVDRPAQQGAVARIFKRHEGTKPMSSMDIAKQIEQTGALAEEVLELKTQELLKRQPELSHAQAFSRVYSDRANRDVTVAEKRARNQRIGATAPSPASAAIAKGNDALRELNEAAAALQRLDPNLTKEKAFALAYKNNPKLAARERSAFREALFA